LERTISRTLSHPEPAEAIRRLAAALLRHAATKATGGDCAKERKKCSTPEPTESLKFHQIDRDTQVSLNMDLEATDLQR
jgi:hypothetical protein